MLAASHLLTLALIRARGAQLMQLNFAIKDHRCRCCCVVILFIVIVVIVVVIIDVGVVVIIIISCL